MFLGLGKRGLLWTRLGNANAESWAESFWVSDLDCYSGEEDEEEKEEKEVVGSLTLAGVLFQELRMREQ